MFIISNRGRYFLGNTIAYDLMIKQNKLKIFTIFIAFVCIYSPLNLLACLRVPHEWTVISTNQAPTSASYFGLIDALSIWRSELSTGTAQILPSKIRVIRIFQGNLIKNTLAPQILQNYVKNAFLAVFPAQNSVTFNDEPLDPNASVESLLQTHHSWNEDGFLDIYILRNEQQVEHFLDIIFFSGANVRTVLRDNTHIILRLTSRNGHLLDLREIKVSPAIIVDTTLSSNFSFLSYFEKNDHWPMLLDFGEIFQNVASEAYKFRPQEQRLPDLPSSLPMVSPEQH